MAGASVPVGGCLRYLGLHIDSRWRFEEHFRLLVPRVEGVASLLGRLLPNLGGPSEKVRRLYVGVVRSMALYGSPVWARVLPSSRFCRGQLRRLQRVVAIRVARGYRTLPHETAVVLAKVLPFEIHAEVYATVYRCVRDRDTLATPTYVATMRRLAMESARIRWYLQLASGRAAGQRAVNAILPIFEQWLDCRHTALSYRLTQILTGHGCLGEYLRAIGAEETAICRQCGAEHDTAQHVLEDCPAFHAERRELRNHLGWDLSLREVIRAIVNSRRCWKAMVSFCEEVLTKKEAAERDHEASDPARAARRDRRRAHRRRR